MEPTTSPTTPAHAPASTPRPSPAPRVRDDSRLRLFPRVAILGFVSGLVAVAFGYCLYTTEHLRDDLVASLRDAAGPWGWAILAPAAFIIGCVVGLMVRFCPESSGSGIPHVHAVLLHARSMRWWRLLPVKFAGGVLGIGLGGLSLGREGPTVQIGAAVGQAISRILRLGDRAAGQMMSCGAGAGVAAAFNAPLAGFIFVIEELRREMSPLTYGGALIAAVCADIVTRGMLSDLPSFHIALHSGLPLLALPAVAALGAAAGVIGVAFNRSLIRSARAGARLRSVPRWMRPGIACAVAAIAVWFLPQIAGGGHATAQSLLAGQLVAAPLAFLALILVGKFLLTVLSYASGAPGGIFAPMLVMGALLGVLAARLWDACFPAHDMQAEVGAVLGMAAFFTASVRAPLTGIVLILEMTGGYQHLFPLAVACLTAYLVAEALGDEPIYEALLTEDLRRGKTAPGGGAGPTEPIHLALSIEFGSPMDGKLISEAGLPSGVLIVAIDRRGRDIVPTGATRLHAGDLVTFIIPAEQAADAITVAHLTQAQ